MRTYIPKQEKPRILTKFGLHQSTQMEARGKGIKKGKKKQKRYSSKTRMNFTLFSEVVWRLT